MKLKATIRSIVGKKVKHLRSEGLIPSSVYGPGQPSRSISVNIKEFKETFSKVGYTKFFDLEIENNPGFKVLVKEVAIHPVKDYIEDISFYQIDEKRKITVEVPITVTGESPAIKQKLGFLVQQMETVALHCLPKDLPASLEINIGSIETATDSISINQLELPEGVELVAGDAATTTAALTTATTEKKA
jgi:large subunit ribosomal protein L25